MKKIIAIILSAGLIALPATAQFQGNWNSGQARDAAQQGKIKSLSEIYGMLRKRYGGQPLDASLAGGTIYAIKWETGQGRVLDLRVDAQTGKVLSERGAG